MLDHTLQTAQNGVHSDVTQWSAGLPLVEDRVLSDAEKETLRQEIRRWRTRAWRSMAALPLPFLAIFGMTRAFGAEQSETIGSLLAIVSMILFFVVPAGLLVTAGYAFPRARILSRDLALGYVKHFGGVWSEPPIADRTLGELRKARLAGVTLPSPQSFEVAPASRRLWSVNGVRPHGWGIAQWSSAAQVPTGAATAAKWAEPLSPLENSPRFNQRTLSATEKQELEHHQRRFWMRPLVPTLIFSLWIGVPLTIHLTLGLPIEIEPQAYLLILLALWSWMSFMTGIGRSRKVEHDIRNGFVVIVVSNTTTEGGEAPAVDQSSSEITKNSWCEYLPLSRLFWSQDGQPASWRRVAGHRF